MILSNIWLVRPQMSFRAGTEMARKKVARKRRQQENFKHTKAKHYKHPQASVALNCEWNTHALTHLHSMLASFYYIFLPFILDINHSWWTCAEFSQQVYLCFHLQAFHSCWVRCGVWMKSKNVRGTFGGLLFKRVLK